MKFSWQELLAIGQAMAAMVDLSKKPWSSQEYSVASSNLGWEQIFFRDAAWPRETTSCSHRKL